MDEQSTFELKFTQREMTIILESLKEVKFGIALPVVQTIEKQISAELRPIP